jgi:hypothetical protein
MFKIGILLPKTQLKKIGNRYKLALLSQKSPKSCQKPRFYSDYLKNHWRNPLLVPFFCRDPLLVPF